MDPISIGLLIASAAASAYTANQAQKNQSRAQEDAIRQSQARAERARQEALAAQTQASDVAARRVAQFEPDVRQGQQQQIADQLTQQFDQAAQPKPITAQGIEVGKTIEGGSDAYQASKARQALQTAQANHELAALFGRIGAPDQLRRNEAVGIGDSASEIGRIGTSAGIGQTINEANNNNLQQIDQAKITSAGQPSIGGTLVAGVLGGLGSSGMAGNWLKSVPAAAVPNRFSGPLGGWIGVGPQ